MSNDMLLGILNAPNNIEDLAAMSQLKFAAMRASRAISKLTKENEALHQQLAKKEVMRLAELESLMTKIDDYERVVKRCASMSDSEAKIILQKHKGN